MDWSLFNCTALHASVAPYELHLWIIFDLASLMKEYMLRWIHSFIKRVNLICISLSSVRLIQDMSYFFHRRMSLYSCQLWELCVDGNIQFFMQPGESVYTESFNWIPEPIPSYCLPYAKMTLRKFCVIVYSHCRKGWSTRCYTFG